MFMKYLLGVAHEGNKKADDSRSILISSKVQKDIHIHLSQTGANLFVATVITSLNISKKVQVGKDQEKAQSERDSHSKNRGGKKTN